MMNHISNVFAVLDLDAVDDRQQITSAAPAKVGEDSTDKCKKKGKKSKKNSSTQNGKVEQQSLPTSSGENRSPLVWIDLEMTDKSKKKGKNSEKNASTQNGKVEQQSLPTSSGEYKSPLVWIDLEMTGLEVEVDRILEIACIITDGNLTKSVEGPDLIIHQSKECLDKMGEWCQSHHAASGLTKKVLESTITEKAAEEQVIEFVKKHIRLDYNKPLLAGNSIYMDFGFLKKYMPKLADLFSHVVVDVSSVMALCIRWHPREHRAAPRKENKHRAMDDIRESIMELKYYKQNIFKQRK